jgi:hypothetical protein
MNSMSSESFRKEEETRLSTELYESNVKVTMLEAHLATAKKQHELCRERYNFAKAMREKEKEIAKAMQEKEKELISIRTLHLESISDDKRFTRTQDNIPEVIRSEDRMQTAKSQAEPKSMSFNAYGLMEMKRLRQNDDEDETPRIKKPFWSAKECKLCAIGIALYGNDCNKALTGLLNNRSFKEVTCFLSDNWVSIVQDSKKWPVRNEDEKTALLMEMKQLSKQLHSVINTNVQPKRKRNNETGDDRK